MLPIPFDHQVVGAAGAAAGVAITVSEITSDDTVLALIAWTPGASMTVSAVDPSEITVGDGEITPSTTSTAGKLVCVVFSRQ